MTTLAVYLCPSCSVPLSALSKNHEDTNDYPLYLCADHGLWRVYPDGRIEPHVQPT